MWELCENYIALCDEYAALMFASIGPRMQLDSRTIAYRLDELKAEMAAAYEEYVHQALRCSVMN